MNQMQLIEQFLDEKIHLIATELSLFFFLLLLYH